METFTAEQFAEAARQLGAIRAAVERGDLEASRGERDRLRGASIALEALATAGNGTEKATPR